MGLNQLALLACALIAFASFAAENPGRDLAAATNGGAIVRFSTDATNAASLIDAKRPNSFGAPAEFPCEVVIGFKDDRVALLDRIVIVPQPKSGPTNWPRRVSISVSTNSPLDGFEEATVASLEQDATPQSFPINRRARFVLLRVLDNFGGSSVGIARVSALEGSAPAYVSILDSPAHEEKHAAPELRDANEPNNSARDATKLTLGKPLNGAIDPLTDEDWFRFTVPGKAPSAVTFNLEGEPYVRTAVALLHGEQVLKQFDPGRQTVERTEFTWMVPPGESLLRLTEPPTSLVLIWDSSTSMRGSETNLQRAVRAFLGAVKAPDRVQLIQFSGKVDVLTTNFLSDSAELLSIFNKRYKLESGTAFFDAVRRGAELLDKVPGNRAIVVMTDGADTRSQVNYSAFWSELAQKRIRIYTVGLGKELARFTEKTATTSSRNLSHIALASNGRYFFTEKGEELLNLYQRISEEMHSRVSYGVSASMSRGEGKLFVTAGARRTVTSGKLAPIEIIFDASGSMREKLDGRRKIETMKEVMVRTIDSLADDQLVALRVFGHRIDSQRPGARTDSELVFPLARIDKPRLREIIQKLQPRGTTPIAYSLQQLPADLASASEEKQVVLVTDGREEAGGDPVKVVNELRAKRFSFRLNVVGFALSDRASKEEMRTIAELTGGKFYDATSPAGLRDAVEQSATEEALRLPFEVVDAAGEKLADGLTGDAPVTLPEGVFTVRVREGKAANTYTVHVQRNAAQRLSLLREGDQFASRIEVISTR